MKITMTFTLLLLVSFLSTGQNYFNDNVEKKAQSEEANSSISSQELSSSDKEWNKIKTQIQKNKRKYSKSKNLVFAKIMIDTVHVDVTIFKEKSLITEW